jgi:hypothetical protein
MFGSNGYGRKRWSRSYALGYRVGFRRGWNGAHGRYTRRGRLA